jgi:hypothetical protein
MGDRLSEAYEAAALEVSGPKILLIMNVLPDIGGFMSQQADAANTAIMLWFHAGCQRRGVTHPCVMSKRLALISSLILAFTLTGQSAESPAKDGGWSEAVNGLRARLVFEEVPVFHGTRVPKVYLELHNASGTMGFDFDAGKSIRFDLRSSDGKPGPKPAYSVVDGFRSKPFRSTIPYDGTLKFPITWSGYGIPRDGGTALGFEGAFWVIPASDKSQYFLSATLEVPQTQGDLNGVYRWHGTIKIPPVIVMAGK